MRRNILLFVSRLIPALGFGLLVVGADVFRDWLWAETSVSPRAGHLTALPAEEAVPVERMLVKNSCDAPPTGADELADERYFCCPTTYNECPGCCRASFPWRSSGRFCYQTHDDCMKAKTGICYFCNGDKC